MSEMTVNVPLLRKAVEWAEAEAAKPEGMSQWFQGAWAKQPELIGRDQSCGTCYCIAGFVVGQQSVVSAGSHVWEVRVDGETVEEEQFSDRARQLLGLTFGQSNMLFEGGNTVEDVRRIAESIAGERL